MGEKLDTKKLSPEVELLQDSLLSNIIGQDRAIKQIIKAYVPSRVNMHRENRPLGVFLFMGPTGVGKSETVKQFAKFLLGDRGAVTKIDCNEYQHSHEVSKLLGAPPSYVGYNDEPRLSQRQIDKYQTKDNPFNVVLFDEIEKADSRLFDTIMGIMGDGEAVLGNGQKVDFSKTFIFITSNLGSDATRALIEGGKLGFQTEQQARADMDDRIYRMSKEAVKKAFRPEFINRLDRIIVFRSLSKTSLRIILAGELRNLQVRIYKSPFRRYEVGSKEPVPDRRSITFKATEAAKEFLLREGTSDVYGARELNRAIDKYLAFPLAALIDSKQLVDGDVVAVDYIEEEKELTFIKNGKSKKEQILLTDGGTT